MVNRTFVGLLYISLAVPGLVCSVFSLKAISVHKVITVAAISGLYFCILLLNNVLAINRLLINCFPFMTQPDKIYLVSPVSVADSDEPVFIQLFSSVCWLVALIQFLFYLTPGAGLRFSLETFDWKYFDSDVNAVFQQIEPVISLGSTLFDMVCYSSIIAFMLRNKSQHRLERHSSLELRLVIISVISFAYQLAMIIPFQFGSYFIPDTPAAHLFYATSWLFFPAFHQIVLLVLNRDLRRRVMKDFVTSVN
uniref:Serpentine Receptor, class T n=1 Tax=Steinernema glaseri TaxID=37863 RepID=A0A1I7Y3H5_9BILA